MAPFVDDGSLVEQYQPRIAADDGLQCRAVRRIERIFRTGDVPPVLHGLVSTGCETVETVSVLLGVFVDGIDFAEVTVVGTLQHGGDEQEGISVPGQYAVRQVVAGLLVGDGEVVDGRLVALLQDFLMGVLEHPCRVVIRVVILRELLGNAVLLADEGGLVDSLLRPFRYLHSLLDVLADVIGAEVEDGKVVEAQQGGRKDEGDGEVEGYPLVGCSSR